MLLNLFLIFILLETIYYKGNLKYLEKYSVSTGLPLWLLCFAVFIQFLSTILLTFGITRPIFTNIGASLLLPNWLFVLFFFRKSPEFHYYLSIFVITLHLSLSHMLTL